MFEAGRDLWRSFGKTLLLKQGHLLRTMSSWLWNISRGGDSTTSLGYFMVKRYFLVFGGIVLYFNLCSFSFVWASLKRASFHSLCTLPLYRIIRYSSEASLLEAEEFQLSPLFFTLEVLQSLNLHRVFMFLLYWGAQNWTQYSRHDLSPAEERVRIISLDCWQNFDLFLAQWHTAGSR